MITTANSTAPRSRTVNKLTAAENYKLLNWLKNLHETGTLSHTDTKENLAKAAAIELAFPVTGHNIQGALDVLEISLPRPPASKEAALQARIEQLEARCEQLEGHVWRLCSELGLSGKK